MAALSLNGTYILTFTAEETVAMQRVAAQHPRGAAGMQEVIMRPVEEWTRNEAMVTVQARHAAYEAASPSTRAEVDRLIGFSEAPPDAPSR